MIKLLPLFLILLAIASCKSDKGPEALPDREPLGIEWSKDVPAKHDIVNGRAVTFEDEIYVLAGVAGRFMKYHPETYAWTDLAGLPAPRTEAAMVLWNEKIIVAGGVDDSSHLMSRVDYYDLKDQVWRMFASLPQGRARFQLNIYDSILYANGGACGENERTYSPCTEVVSYNDSTMQWEILTNIPSSRFGHVSVSNGPELYMIGGYGLVPNMGTYYLNHLDKQVDTRPAMPDHRGNFGAVLVGDYILTFGGKTREMNSPMERYSIKEKKWEPLPSCPFWTDRFAYTRWKNTIYVFGGSQAPLQVWKGKIVFKE
jgi:hypothetical protein